MTEPTIKEVVANFKAVFGDIEFKATNHLTCQVGGSSNWVDLPQARLEISANDFIALGKCSLNNPPSPQAWAGLAKLTINKR
jgi:hypothetical protein